MDLYKQVEGFFDFFKTPKGKRIGKILRYVFLVSIISFLFYQVSQIGWSEIWASLPTTPWFYIIFLILYISLPMTEQYIYRQSLDFSFTDGLKVFIKKKILNQEIVGYSGEAYFYIWAKNNLNVSSKKLLSIIKDNTIISSIASTLTAFVLLGCFLGIVNVNVLDGSWFDKRTLIFGGIIIAILVSTLIVFRKKIISVNKVTARKMFLAHEARIIWVYTFEVLQWFSALPHIPIYIWFTFLSVRIISSRIPLLPNRDLLFLSASAGIAKYVEVDEAAMVSILLTTTVLTKIMNLVLFLVFSLDKEVDKVEDLDLSEEE